MKNKTLLEKLVYLKSRDIKIKWTKSIPYELVYLNGMSGSISLTTYPPIMPTQLILHTNDSLEQVTTSVDACLTSIEEYDSYMESLEDNKEVMELKKAFEEHI